MATRSAAELTSDESRRWLHGDCPDALDRLSVFYWEWLSDRGPKTLRGDEAALRAWIRRKHKPVTADVGVNEEGLEAAAREVLRHVQRRLHAFHERGEPLDMEVSGFDLPTARRGALTALFYLGGNRRAKDVEAEVSPGGQPLAVCLGSAKGELVTVPYYGRIEMPGYAGCLRTFPDAPFGTGDRWPRICPHCRKRQSNLRAKARTELRRRVLRAVEDGPT